MLHASNNILTSIIDSKQATNMIDATFNSHSPTQLTSIHNNSQPPFEARLDIYPPFSKTLVNPLSEDIHTVQPSQGGEDSEG